MRRFRNFLPTAFVALMAIPVCAQDAATLREALTFHASFDKSLDADFSLGKTDCTVQQGDMAVAATPNDDVKLAQEGKFGGALQAVRKSRYWPQYFGDKVLGYNAQNWSTSVSLWLKLDPDKDLEPGYCDPVQIVGDSVDKGFIFLEWSKDHMPRRFRFAIRPLKHIWNPTNVGWEEIPVEKRPVIELQTVPFSAEKWTHVAFTIAHVNDKTNQPVGKLYIDGELVGTIENWDLTIDWDPAKVRLVLGAAYVGLIDDVAIFNRVLTAEEVKQVHALPGGIGDLRK